MDIGLFVEVGNTGSGSQSSFLVEWWGKEKGHIMNLGFSILSLIYLRNVQVETVSKQLYMPSTKRRHIFERR